MIDFQAFSPARREEFERYLRTRRGCEYGFTNLFLWGRQRAAVTAGCLVFFSQFGRSSVYPFPAGSGDTGAALDAIAADAAERGIVCRITAMDRADCVLLDRLYPGRFHIHCDRDGFDYVYDIDALADLKGRRYQQKRNHVNRFRQRYPVAESLVLTGENAGLLWDFAEKWYAVHRARDPHMDFHLERTAISRAVKNWDALGLEGLALADGGEILAVTAGSRLSGDTFDVHFEKAMPEAEGAYAAICQAFARHLREKYPALRYLDREDDMGLEGLRKAKLSYHPAFLLEKYWAEPVEDGHGV